MPMVDEARGWRANLNVLNERICFKYNFLFGVVLLLISTINAGFGVIRFERAASTHQLDWFAVVGLITALLFFMIFAIAAKGIAERVALGLFSLDAAFDLAIRGVAIAAFPVKLSVLVRHYNTLSLALGLCTLPRSW
jgi:hypothetical protein